MAVLELKVNGLIEDLESLGPEIEKKMMDELKVTGLMIESDYKVAVPVDTGRLRSSAHTEHADFRNFSYNDSQGNIFDGKLSSAPNSRQVIVGTNVIYSTIIEELGGKVKGQNAMENAFKKNTLGLMDRLIKLI